MKIRLLDMGKIRPYSKFNQNRSFELWSTAHNYRQQTDIIIKKHFYGHRQPHNGYIWEKQKLFLTHHRPFSIVCIICEKVKVVIDQPIIINNVMYHF